MIDEDQYKNWLPLEKNPIPKLPRRKIAVNVANHSGPGIAFSDTIGGAGFSHEMKPIFWKELTNTTDQETL